MTEAVRTLHEYDTSEQFVARVISNETITSPGAEAEVRELVLEVQRPDFPYQVGQSVGVIAPGEPGLGEYEHFRLYSVADLPELDADGLPRIKLCVRRCSYIDDITGERHPGIASNYLCDRQPGDRITVTGPFGLVFEVPEEMDANLILIGSGTGIAPFRAFVKHIYRHVPEWQGRIWLLYGAKSGLELLYMNDEKDDFVQYYDQETFEAFKALVAATELGRPDRLGPGDRGARRGALGDARRSQVLRLRGGDRREPGRSRPRLRASRRIAAEVAATQGGAQGRAALDGAGVLEVGDPTGRRRHA